MPELLTIRALPSLARQASLPDPCLADPLRPETWRPVVAARDEAPAGAQTQVPAGGQPSSTAMTTAPLAREGHA